MARRRTSYAWALKVPDDYGASEGLGWAKLLAQNALEWRKEALRGGPRPCPLTPEELATNVDVSATTVRRRILEARTAAFGSLSDSAIYYRLAHAKADEECARVCKAPDCGKPLPFTRTRRRKYCHPRCRRRHHYQRQTPGAAPQPHLRGARKELAIREPLMSAEEAKRTLTGSG
jgi:hypothetical protein